MKKILIKNFKGRRVIIRVILFFLFLLFVGSYVYFGMKLHKELKQGNEAKEITSELIHEKKKNGIKRLKRKYKDMVGWIKILETDFSYPVMQTGTKGHSEKDWMYYLHRDVHGKYSFYGTPFLDVRCTSESDNKIVYGHNINGRRYFGYLQNFREKDFFFNHQKISYTEVSKKEEMYEVLAVIETDIASPIYDFTILGNDKDYQKIIKYIVNNSKYRNECLKCVEKEMNEKTVEAFFHTYQFITLSTCRTGEGEDKRLVVIGCKKMGLDHWSKQGGNG